MTYLFISKLRQLDTVAMIVGLQLGHVPLEHGDVTHHDSELSPNLLSVVVELLSPGTFLSSSTSSSTTWNLVPGGSSSMMELSST